MNSPQRREIVANFSGISKSNFLGHKVDIDLFTDELLVKAPDYNNTALSYKFDFLQQLNMTIRQAEQQETILDIKISYPGNRMELESVSLESEDAERVMSSYKLYQDKLSSLPKANFDQVKEIKTVALVEFNKRHDVRNYNYGTLLLSNREINFISYNGKNFIIHLDRFENYFYYQAVILPTDILGYSRWVSIHKVSELEKGYTEIVTFLTGEKQSLLIKQLLEMHYEKHLNNKWAIIQKQWLDFNKGVEEALSLLQADPETIRLASEFIEEHGDSILLNGEFYFQFEHLLRKIFYQSHINLIPEDEDEINILPEVLNFFENCFLCLVKNLAEIHKLDNGDVTVYAVWKLLKSKAISYYSALFEQLYDGYFRDCEDIKEFMAGYENIDDMNKGLPRNIALFTYYLMKKYWENEDSFSNYLQTVKQELENTAKNIE